MKPLVIKKKIKNSVFTTFIEPVAKANTHQQTRLFLFDLSLLDQGIKYIDSFRLSEPVYSACIIPQSRKYQIIIPASHDGFSFEPFQDKFPTKLAQSEQWLLIIETLHCKEPILFIECDNTPLFEPIIRLYQPQKRKASAWLYLEPDESLKLIQNTPCINTDDLFITRTMRAKDRIKYIFQYLDCIPTGQIIIKTNQKLLYSNMKTETETVRIPKNKRFQLLQNAKSLEIVTDQVDEELSVKVVY